MNQVFETIYEKESDAIFRFCLMRVSDRDQALDITQETFLRLWNSLIKDEEIINSKAFLFTIARRLVIDWYRKKKSLSLDSILLEGSDQQYDIQDEKTSESNLLMGIEARYLISKIKELDSSYQDSIYLRYVEDLSPPEIGEILEISANAASVRINRGIKELKKKIGDNIDK